MVIYFLDLLAIISSKNRVMTVYLHMKLQSPSSVVIIQQRNGLHCCFYYYIVQSFSISTVAIDMHGNSSSRRVLSVENDFHASPYLQLQCRDNTDFARVWYARLYFQRSPYRASTESNCT